MIPKLWHRGTREWVSCFQSGSIRALRLRRFGCKTPTVGVARSAVFDSNDYSETRACHTASAFARFSSDTQVQLVGRTLRGRRDLIPFTSGDLILLTA